MTVKNAKILEIVYVNSYIECIDWLRFSADSSCIEMHYEPLQFYPACLSITAKDVDTSTTCIIGT
jgi:hypothetical protein